MQKAIEFYRDKDPDIKMDQLKDWITSDIELTYVLVVHMQDERYHQYARKRVAQEEDEALKVMKTESEVISEAPSSEIKNTMNRLMVHE